MTLPSPHNLTPRQWDVVYLVACGWTTHAIACELGVSPAAVTHHIGRLMRRAGVDGRVGLAVRALQLGWVRLEEVEIGG